MLRKVTAKFDVTSEWEIELFAREFTFLSERKFIRLIESFELVMLENAVSSFVRLR